MRPRSCSTIYLFVLFHRRRVKVVKRMTACRSGDYLSPAIGAPSLLPRSQNLRSFGRTSDSEAQLDLLRNPLRARQCMTACKTARPSTHFGHNLSRPCGHRPRDRRKNSLCVGSRRQHALIAASPEPQLEHYHQNVVDHDHDCCWRC